jgi:hypothetical protein
MIPKYLYEFTLFVEFDFAFPNHSSLLWFAGFCGGDDGGDYKIT